MESVSLEADGVGVVTFIVVVISPGNAGSVVVSAVVILGFFVLAVSIVESHHLLMLILCGGAIFEFPQIDILEIRSSFRIYKLLINPIAQSVIVIRI